MAFVIVNIEINFNFYTRHIYIGWKYQLSIYFICNNLYRS